MTAPIMITGRAYQRRATLEIHGETLAWRARRGLLHTVRENIATTCHEIRDVRWLEKRWNLGGLGLAVLAVIWTLRGDVVVGPTTFAIATALVVWRRVRPRSWLGIDLGTRWLVLRVDRRSVSAARALAGRLEQRLLAGAVEHAPIALP